MAMSRRKQPRPKSFKEDDEILFVLPDELKFDKKTNNILTRIHLKKDHRFGPFSAIMHIEDEIECFQLLDIKHNWLAHCSLLENSSINLKISFQDNQLFAIVTESISIDTYLCSNKIILPKLNMNKDIQIKEEPVETEIKIKAAGKTHNPLVFICKTCDIRFSNRNTLDAHRQHYCTKRETTKSHSTDLPISIRATSMKRKSTDNTDSSSTPTKRLSLLSKNTYCHECDILFSKADNLIQHKLHYCPTNLSSKIKNKTIPFDRPVQIGKFIYVPIPVIPSQVDTPNQDNKPLDLSKPKTINNQCNNSIVPSNSPLDLTIENSNKIVQQQQQLYRCEYCSIYFRSLKTLHAHQDNYCIKYEKQKKNDNNLLTNTTRTSRSQPSSSIISKPILYNSLNSNPRSTFFMCRLCQYRGNTLRGMRMHFKFHLSNNEPCSDDDIIIKSSTIPTTTQLLLKCTICSAMFDYEQTLLNHIKCVHTNETLLKCLECQSRFCSKWNLIRHMKFSHTNMKYDEHEQDDQQMKLNESSDSMNLITQQIDMEPIERNLSNGILMKKKFSCLFCHIQFGSIDTLKQHMTSYCSSRPRTNDIKEKVKNDTYCLSCKISFQHQASYDAHKLYYCRSSSQTNDKIPA